MVHQHFMLIPVMTVAENIVLGTEPHRGPLLDMAAAVERVRDLSRPLRPRRRSTRAGRGRQRRHPAADRDPQGPLPRREGADPRRADGGADAPGDRRPARGPARAARARHVDHHHHAQARRGPAGGRPDQRAAPRKEGRHDPGGRRDGTEPRRADGRAVRCCSEVERGAAHPGEAVLSIDDLHVQDDREIETVRGLSFAVRAGEIVGIAGVDGNGQTELAEAIAGMRKVASGSDPAGRARPDRTHRRVPRAEAGIGHIPQDRQRHGLVLDFSIAENTALHDYERPPISQFGWLNPRAMIASARAAASRRFDVRGGSPTAPARALSGGNQQKLVLAREIDLQPQLLLAAQPTRGLDVGAIEFVHRQLIEQRDAGRRRAADLLRARRDLRTVRPDPRDVRGQASPSRRGRIRRTRPSSASR